MKQKWMINSTNISESKLILEMDNIINLDNVVAREQILVDSDELSFIYLLEKKEEYVYLVIHHDIWSVVQQARKQKIPVFLSDGTNILELKEFHEELNDLVDNIQGNSNYGDSLVNAVENIFV